MWMKDIQLKHISWLWKPYIQRGAINLLTGDPGVGKSTIVCDIVAALTTGRALHGQAPLEPMNCWIMNAEDNADDTIGWRLLNQQADFNRVLITDQKKVINNKVAKEIIATCKTNNIQFLGIDPLQSWMGAETNMNQAAETRAWGDIMREVARECNLAVMISRHRRKGGPGDNKIMGGLGSIDITGYARSELAALKGRNGLYYIERIKGNVGKTGQALSYSIATHTDPLNEHGILCWNGLIDVNQQPATSTGFVPKKLEQCKEWLIQLLRDGSKPAPECFKAATAAGYSESTLKRARKEVANAIKVGENDWWWQLRDDAPQLQVCA